MSKVEQGESAPTKCTLLTIPLIAERLRGLAKSEHIGSEDIAFDLAAYAEHLDALSQPAPEMDLEKFHDARVSKPSDDRARWIPVNERLPPVDTDVIVVNANDTLGQEIVSVVKRNHIGAANNADYNDFASRGYTHWMMPIPSPHDARVQPSVAGTENTALRRIKGLCVSGKDKPNDGDWQKHSHWLADKIDDIYEAAESALKESSRGK